MSKTTWLQAYIRGMNSLLIIALIFTTLILFSGCGDDDSNGQAQTDPDCGDALCIGIFSQQRSIRAIAKATGFARQDINDAGGNVEFIIRQSDQLFTPQQHRELLQELIDSGAEAMVGPGTSEESRRIFELLSDTPLVAVSFAATSVELTRVLNMEILDQGGTPYFFRTVPNDAFQARILAGQIRDQENTGDVLIVHRNDNYGNNLVNNVNTELESLSLSQATAVPYDLFNSDDPMFDEKTDMVIARVQEAMDGLTVRSVIMIVSADEGGNLIKNMLDRVISSDIAQYYITDSLAVAHLHELVDPEDPATIDGFKATTPCALSDPTQRIAEFRNRFEPDEQDTLQFAPHAYDAVIAVALASLSAGSQDPAEYVSHMRAVTRDGTQCRSYAECAEFLTDNDPNNNNIDYEGISGPIEFDENGDIEQGWYFVYTHDAEGGRQRQVFHVPDLTEGEEP